MNDHLTVKHITPKEISLASNPEGYICNREGCNRKFKSSPSLRFHELQFHDHIKPPKKKRESHIEERYHCPVQHCQYYYNDSSSRYFAKLRYLKQHYLKVHSVCPFSCNRCMKSFSTRAYLESHELYCGKDMSCCCGKTFSVVTGLQTHVRRTNHESEFLKNYAYRKVIENELNAPQKSSNARPTHLKSEPPHLVAAIALSELAFTGLKRVSTAEVGVQTVSQPPSQRCPKDVFMQEDSKVPKQKQRQTTEMETQTQLTDFKNKSKRKGGVARVANCSIATDTENSGFGTRRVGSNSVLPHNFYDRSKMSLSSPTSKNGKAIKKGLGNCTVYKRICSKDLKHQYNSLGTQTSLNFDLNDFASSQEYLSDDFFQGYSKPKGHSSDRFERGSATKEVMKGFNENLKTLTNSRIDEMNSSGNISSGLLEEDEELLSVSPSGRISKSQRLFSCNRSSSIETQTDHDVFLSNHFQASEDVDDIILTSSETQTCENFSDIEPFLCSTIHTQTVDGHNSSSELFPELCSFSVDMQTQTAAEDISNCIDIHTQTVMKSR